MQKLESVRRYIFPLQVLNEEDIRGEIAENLLKCEPFMNYFIPREFNSEKVRCLLDKLFDYFYLDSDAAGILDFTTVRLTFEPYLKAKITRKVIDYIELFTQQALQEDRFTRNVILRDLHFKFTKVRLRLGFKQNVFGIFKFE